MDILTAFRRIFVLSSFYCTSSSVYLIKSVSRVIPSKNFQCSFHSNYNNNDLTTISQCKLLLTAAVALAKNENYASHPNTVEI